MRMALILVAGGAGFLGLNTARALTAAGREVVITTRRPLEERLARVVAESAIAHVEVVDLTSTFQVSNLFARYAFDSVAYTAATAHMFAASRSKNFDSYAMFFNCLEAATNSVVRRFVLASSIVVYRGLSGPSRKDMALPPDVWVNPPCVWSMIPHFEVAKARHGARRSGLWPTA